MRTLITYAEFGKMKRYITAPKFHNWIFKEFIFISSENNKILIFLNRITQNLLKIPRVLK